MTRVRPSEPPNVSKTNDDWSWWNPPRLTSVPPPTSTVRAARVENREITLPTLDGVRAYACGEQWLAGKLQYVYYDPLLHPDDLWYVLELCAGECDALLDVTNPDRAGAVGAAEWWWHAGTDAGEVDAHLAAVDATWNEPFAGTCHVVVHLTSFTTYWQAQIPNLLFHMRTRKVLCADTGLRAYSTNVWDQWYDFVRWSEGKGLPAGRVDAAAFAAAKAADAAAGRDCAVHMLLMEPTNPDDVVNSFRILASAFWFWDDSANRFTVVPDRAGAPVAASYNDHHGLRSAPVSGAGSELLERPNKVTVWYTDLNNKRQLVPLSDPVQTDDVTAGLADPIEEEHRLPWLYSATIAKRIAIYILNSLQFDLQVQDTWNALTAARKLGDVVQLTIPARDRVFTGRLMQRTKLPNGTYKVALLEHNEAKFSNVVVNNPPKTPSTIPDPTEFTTEEGAAAAAPVQSVAGRIGDVTLGTADVAGAESAAHAAATYETIVHAAGTYETAVHAAATYAPITNPTFSGPVTLSAGGNLFLSGAGTTQQYARFTNTGGDAFLGIERSTGGALFLGSGAYATVLGSIASTSLQFATSNTVRATITPTGNVIIGGGITPVTRFSVQGSTIENAGIESRTTVGNNRRAEFGFDAAADVASLFAWDDTVGGPKNLTLQAYGGSVGIGAGGATPASLLSNTSAGDGNITANGLSWVTANVDNYVAYFKSAKYGVRIWETSGTGVALAVTGTSTLNGNVGIGTSGPYKLSVLVTGAADIASFQSDQVGGYIVLADSGTPTWGNAPRIGAIVNDLVFRTTATERMRIGSSGSVAVSGPTSVSNSSGDLAALTVWGRNNIFAGYSRGIYVNAGFDANDYALKVQNVRADLGAHDALIVDGAGTVFIPGNIGIACTPTAFKLETAGHVGPNATFAYDLGAHTTRWRSLYAAELRVETLVAQDVRATIGGSVIVGPTTKLTSDLAAGATTIYVEHNEMQIGDVAYLMAAPGGIQQIEFMAITGGPTGAGPYAYTVTRNLDGSGANDWPAGSAVTNSGAAGDGFIELYSFHGIKTTAEVGPTIVGNVRNSGTYNDWTTRWAIGNLNGLFGYATDTYGAAFGVPTAAWLKVDPTNGIRIGHNATTKVQIDAAGNASFAGTVTANAGSIGGVTIAASSIYVGTGTYGNTNTAFYLNSSGQMSLKDKLTWDGTTLTISGAITASSGAIGGWSISSGALVGGTGAVIRAGQTAYNTGVGFFLTATGLGTVQLSLGNPAANCLLWDGTYLSISGAITATSGTIGGWTLGIGYAYNNTGSGAGMAPGDYPFFGGALYANRATAPFRVDTAGNLVASSATISGSVTATSGSIGGWTIGASELEGPSGAVIRAGQTAYNSGTGFWIGNVGGTPKLSIGGSIGGAHRLTWDGATLTVVGAVTATTVSAGNVTISNNNFNCGGKITWDGATLAISGVSSFSGGTVHSTGSMSTEGSMQAASYNSETVYKVNSTQVVGSQGAAVANADGTLASATAQLNALLSRLRSHGLIAT